MSADPARQRFFLLQAMRLGGLALVVVGVLIWRKGLFGLRSDIVGGLVFALGLVEFIVLPTLFRRRWRSPDQPPT